jgi:DNA-directed RNA polymerase subunit RPC12/RpoP
MSEYKYACPVCGQHMRCDSSQAGTVMECPTCFQKITAPQAPAAGDDQKFVLTGTKVGERPLPKTATTTPSTAPAAKNFPWVILIVLLMAGLAGAGGFAFRGKLFKSSAVTPASEVASTAGEEPTPAKTQEPGKPAVIAPPASDANWTLAPGTNAIPDAPVAGRIHGQDFIIERASYHDGTFILREGLRGPVEFGMTVNFSGAQAEALSGKTIKIGASADKAAFVTLHWKDNGTAQSQNFANGYAMRLEFGALANNRLPGKIYLCLADAEKSYLLGSFTAEARKPRPKK